MEKIFFQSIYYFISLWQQAKMKYVCNSFLWHIHSWVSSYISDYCFSKYFSVYPSSFFSLIPIPGQSLQHFNTMNMLMIFRNDLRLRSFSWAPSSYHPTFGKHLHWISHQNNHITAEFNIFTQKLPRMFPTQWHHPLNSLTRNPGILRDLQFSSQLNW